MTSQNIVLILGIFFFVILFIRALQLAVKTGEKGFRYFSVASLMFVCFIVSRLLDNFIGSLIIMSLTIPYVIVISLKYGRRLIVAQKDLSLKEYSPEKPMKTTDYFSLFLSWKGWLKLSEKRGKNQALVIFLIFNIFSFFIIYAVGSYLFPEIEIFRFPRSLFSIVIFLIFSVYLFNTNLEKKQSNKKD